MTEKIYNRNENINNCYHGNMENLGYRITDTEETLLNLLFVYA